MAKALQAQPKPSGPQLHTVTQIAAELGITARTLRFYEGKGLISPNRLGSTRVYMARDRARMILILRGKRLGFSLREIAEYLDLYDADPTLKAQNAKLLKLVTARIGKLEQQRLALDEMLGELRAWKAHAETVLSHPDVPGLDPPASAARGPQGNTQPTPAKTISKDRPDRSRE